MKKIYFIAILFLAVGVAAGMLLSSQMPYEETVLGSTEEPIRIGGAFALSGDAGTVEWGTMDRDGAQLAVDEINQAGGVNGRHVELVIEDTQGSSIGTTNAISALRNLHGLDIVIGPTWFDSFPGAQIFFEDPDSLLITPSAGIDSLQAGTVYPNIFSTFHRPEQAGYELGEYIVNEGHDYVGVMFQNDAYFANYAKGLTRGITEHGGHLTIEYFNPDDDLKTVMLKLHASKADAILVGMYDEAAVSIFAKQRFIIFGDTPIYFDEDIEPFVVDPDIRSGFEGAEYIQPQDPSEEFVDLFIQQYGYAPKFAASKAYDAVYIALDAYEHAPDTMAEYIHQHSYDTQSFGVVSFDDIGGIVGKQSVFTFRKVVNGEIVSEF